MFFISLCDFPKQWLLAGELVEFEYSPKICQFWRIRVLPKMAIFGNLSDSPDSNSPNCVTLRSTRQTRIRQNYGKFGEGRLDRFIPKNIFFLYIKQPSLKICQIRQNAVTDSPDSRSPKCGHLWYSPNLTTFAKGHFWQKCDSPRHIRTSNSPFSQIWGEWPLLINYSFSYFLASCFISLSLWCNWLLWMIHFVNYCLCVRR